MFAGQSSAFELEFEPVNNGDTFQAYVDAASVNVSGDDGVFTFTVFLEELPADGANIDAIAFGEQNAWKNPFEAGGTIIQDGAQTNFVERDVNIGANPGWTSYGARFSTARSPLNGQTARLERGESVSFQFNTINSMSLVELEDPMSRLCISYKPCHQFSVFHSPVFWSLMNLDIIGLTILMIDIKI